MEIRHLQMVREVAASGSLTKAAERLYLTQSALSHQLKEIEAYFETQLFIRDKKQMRLTQAGEVVLESGEKILREVEEARAKVRRLVDRESGEIRLSTECYTSYPWLSGFLRQFRSIHPKVDIKIEADATNCSSPYLVENKIDVAIQEENTNPKFNYTRLFTDEFVAIVPPDHPWVGRAWVDPVDFADQNYIMYNMPEQESSNFNFLYPNRRPPKIYKPTLTEAMIEMVKAGLGVALLPHWVVERAVRTGELVAIPVTQHRMIRTWYAVTLKNKELPPYTTAFIDNLAQYMQTKDEYCVQPDQLRKAVLHQYDLLNLT